MFVRNGVYPGVLNAREMVEESGISKVQARLGFCDDGLIFS